MKDPVPSAAYPTPILFVVFNRPKTTEKVFEAIRKVRPKWLFVAADGPRDHVSGEWETCQEVRRIATSVDWDCEVKTLFREKNLGCGKAVSNAINWFFSHVEEGLILEDDCLPSEDFFPFCSELLERYRHDSRVMQIGGNNLNPPAERDEEYSYFFSNHNYIWGWATWRRAWNLFHYNMKYYDVVKEKRYHERYFKSLDEQVYFRYVFDKMYSNIEEATTWDYQWQYSRMLQVGLSIVPARNLVINLGCGNGATHNVKYHDIIPSLTLEKIGFPLRHPEFMMADLATDEKNFCQVFTTRWTRIKSRIKKLIPDALLKYVACFFFNINPAMALITDMLAAGE